MSLPRFPSFKPLFISDHLTLKKITHQFPPYSDFDFVSLISWNTHEQTLISELNGNLVVRFLDYLTLEPFYSFIGTNDVLGTVTTLLEHSNQQGLFPKLRLIPEHVIAKDLEELSEKFLVAEDRDNYDYIYDLSEKAAMTGEKYDNRRKIINKFRRFYPNHQVVELDLRNQTVRSQIITLTQNWAVTRAADSSEDVKALKRLLDFSSELELFTMGIYDQSNLIAFFVSELIGTEYVVAEFAKSDLKYIGVTPFLSHQVAVNLHQKGFQYINYEQDLGIEGLRKAKLLWHPSHYLKKYVVCIK